MVVLLLFSALLWFKLDPTRKVIAETEFIGGVSTAKPRHW
jgi:hypothetical protein